MEFSKNEVEDIFWILMGYGQSESKDKLLNKIYDVYRLCPICSEFFEKSENHYHHDID
ncbi:conserved hypothetical protein [Acinetobacter proteolyticus]|uniref:Uncharacterized protein n=1 Tax=Acinetobacter proteolyticus TaxID=1776741 RepID=A0A653K1M2_9GAMM|nr:conserved hypothetical protein [Acinetobacter proteolyticus]